MSAAKKCKHCGEWLEARPQAASNQPREAQPNAQDTEVEVKHSNTKKIILIVVGVLVFAFVIWLIILKNQKSDWEKTMEEYNYQTPTTEEVTTVEEVIPGEGQVCPYDGEPDEDDYIASYASMRYSNKYAELNSADIHLMYHDGKKLWYNYWREGSGYDNKLHIYDSETDRETTVRLNKTSMPDSEMEVTDMIERDGGVLTIIMTEHRNSNGWVDGTYVWQYFCSSGNWQALATRCSKAEFVNNRTAVKVGYAESINPDDPIYMQEYRYSYRTFNL